jgi:Lon protease-like protein
MVDHTASMNGNEEIQEEQATSPGLHGHTDARQVVRLVQCSQCSYPLRQPMTLPCGNSLCRTCLPSLHKRENITYPMTAGRQEGFICPFPDCGLEHSVGDCSPDVVLNKIVDLVASEIARYRPMTTDTPTLLDERPHWKNVVDSSSDLERPRSRVLHGGRLVATYTFAAMGELNYRSEVSYTSIASNGDTYVYLDVAVLEQVKEAARGEADCQVCYALILDPLTTSCGHTFCRKCVARVLDHSNLCPICRRLLPMPPDVIAGPTNKCLSRILGSFWPDLVAARAEVSAQEESVGLHEGATVPLFICTLAYPSMPTFLHIFEPRYRLMIRRSLESGDRKFGMIMYNRTGRPQAGSPSTQFMQYGTLLHIERIEMLPDGRSLIETIGVSRFKVLEYGMMDGYVVGRIERIDDISLTEEENLEAQETTGPPPAANNLLAQLDHMPTQELLQVGLNFIARGRAASAPWLHERVLAAYGQPPDDPAFFPYWLASVLPITEDEKYKLLPTTSVRERLKITARWIRRLEAARWYVPP